MRYPSVVQRWALWLVHVRPARVATSARAADQFAAKGMSPGTGAAPAVCGLASAATGAELAVLPQGEIRPGPRKSRVGGHLDQVPREASMLHCENCGV